MDLGLGGKKALVTGGSRGIGRAIVLGLAQGGAKVAACYNRESDDVNRLRAELAEVDGDSYLTQADISDPASVQRFVEEAASRFDGLDIVINNAGVVSHAMIGDLDLEEWHRVLDTNLTSAFLCSKAAYPAFKRAGGGKIINIGSMMSIFGASFAPVYSSSKGGIVQYTRAIATAWAKDNIQCNAVLPGWIDTELTKGAREQVSGLNEMVLSRTPAARWGDPQDLATVAVFLAAPGSGFVTGAAIPIDGGFSVRG